MKKYIFTGERKQQPTTMQSFFTLSTIHSCNILTWSLITNYADCGDLWACRIIWSNNCIFIVVPGGKTYYYSPSYYFYFEYPT